MASVDALISLSLFEASETIWVEFTPSTNGSSFVIFLTFSSTC